MEKLILEETFKTPFVSFDAESGNLILKGRVFPENPDDFFAPILSWLHAYEKQPAPDTRLNIFLAYFNSTSSEYIFRICKAMEYISLQNCHCEVIWEYEAEDEDMKQIGEDYANLLKLNLQLKAVI